MDISKISLFSALENRMAYLGERQSVIAQNIANANTPGYKAMDVKKPTFQQLVGDSVGGLQPVKTHSGHMTMSTNGSTKFKTTSQNSSFDITPTDNEVVIEEQILKMNETAHNYEATTMLYKKMTSLMRTAIGDRQ